MDLANAIAAPPIARRLADVIARWAFDGIDGPLIAATRILSDPFIRACIDRIAVLDQQHRQREWAGSPSGYVCTCGRGAWPCDVRRVLDGVTE